MLALSSALRGMSVEDTDDVVAAFETAFNSGQPDAQGLALLSEAWAPLDRWLSSCVAGGLSATQRAA